MTNDERDEFEKLMRVANEFAKSFGSSGKPTPIDHVALCALIRAVEILAEPAASKTALTTFDFALRNMEPTAEPPAFGDALVERLRRVRLTACANDPEYDVEYDIMQATPEQAAGDVAGIHAILADLAKTNIELPTDDEVAERLADRWVREDGGENVKEDEIVAVRCALVWANNRLAPILAAKDAENARLTEWNQKHAQTIETLQAKVAELNSALTIQRGAANAMGNAITTKDARIEELEALYAAAKVSDPERMETIDLQRKRIVELQKDAKEKHAVSHAYIVSLEKRRDELEAHSAMNRDGWNAAVARVAELEKRLTPPAVDGKTPGQVLKSAIAKALYDGEPHDRQAEIGAKAMLDMFWNRRTREALERVKGQVSKLSNSTDDRAINVAVDIVQDSVFDFIDAELAKLEGAKQAPAKDHVQKRQKYGRDWLVTQTDDALFDLYMQHIGFFDMNGMMTERENMIETLAAIEEDVDDTTKQAGV